MYSLGGQKKDCEGTISDLTAPLVCSSTPERKELRPHQQEAVDILVEYLDQPGDDRRAQCIMACGTGKTLVGIHVAKSLANLTLVAEPSLALVAQTIREYQSQSDPEGPSRYLVVCSDQTIAQPNQDEAYIADEDIPAEVTRDLSRLREFITSDRGGRKKVFTTLHSTPLIASALRETGQVFDLIVIDEAHRTATHKTSAFSLVLQQDRIPAKRRLFLTATPKLIQCMDNAEQPPFYSMDQESSYGPVLYSLPFGKAVAEGLLSEYRVVVAAAKEGETHIGKVSSDAANLSVVLTAKIISELAKKYELSKIITFHPRVDAAYRFAEQGGDRMLREELGRPLWISAVDGKMRSKTREVLLAMLGENPAETLSIISNCRCLSEGVDVPAIDAVAFTHDRGEIDVVQAVGRAIRKSSDDKVGTVIVPVILREGENLTEAAARGGFRRVGQVLQALCTHDSRLSSVLARRSNREDNSEDRVAGPELIIEHFGLQDLDLVRELEPKVIQFGLGLRVTPLNLTLIRDYVRDFLDSFGSFPTSESGSVSHPSASPDETWSGIDIALRLKGRGLPSDSPNSLPKFIDMFFSEERLRLKERKLLTLERIRGFVEYHQASHRGAFPTKESGKVAAPGAVEETWGAIDQALKLKLRGLPPDAPESLSKFLDSEFPRLRLGKRKKSRRVNAKKHSLTVQQIRLYVEDYRASHNGHFPSLVSGVVVFGGKPVDETWAGIDQALKDRGRGLPEERPISLARFLDQEFPGEREALGDRRSKNDLSVALIRSYVDHFRSSNEGRFPTRDSGRVLHPEAPEKETWSSINQALGCGIRGLPTDSPKSLSKLLDQEFKAERKRKR